MKSWLKAMVPKFLVRAYHRRKLADEARRNAQRSPQDVFSEIYRDHKWGGDAGFCSGGGSANDRIVQPYVLCIRAQLKKLFANKPTIVDLGCGDFTVGARLVDAATEYVGVDVVPELIEHLRQAEIPGARFMHLDITRDPLPAGDVCLIRQVLQHLSNAQIGDVLEKLRNYPVVFVTEHYPSDDAIAVPNLDIVHGSGIRLFARSGVYLDKPPFNIPLDAIEMVLQAPYHGFDGLYDPGVIRTFRVTFSATG